MQSIGEKQREVQRLLGRCLLRLQQYEKSAKAILVAHAVSGTVDTFEADRAARRRATAKDALGEVADRLFSEVLVFDGQKPRSKRRDAVTVSAPPTQVHFTTTIQLVLSRQEHRAARIAVGKMVTLRNLLAHRLVERFQIGTVEGCAEASTFLTEAYQTVDAQVELLRGWAKSLEEARASYVALMQRPETLDAVLEHVERQRGR